MLRFPRHADVFSSDDEKTSSIGVRRFTVRNSKRLFHNRENIPKRHSLTIKSIAIGAVSIIACGVVAVLAAITGTASMAASDVPDLGIPVHTRNVEPTGEDGVYTLTYTVEGKANPSVVHLGGDIAVTFDMSGSMSSWASSVESATRTAAQAALEDNANLPFAQQNRIAFGPYDAAATDGFVTDPSQIPAANGGTSADSSGAAWIITEAQSDPRWAERTGPKEAVFIGMFDSSAVTEDQFRQLVELGFTRFKFVIVNGSGHASQLVTSAQAAGAEEAEIVATNNDMSKIAPIFDEIGAEFATAWRLNSPFITDTFSEYVEPVDVNDINVTITERDVSSMDPGEDTTGADASPKADEIKASWEAATRQLKIAWPDNADVGARVQYTVSLKIKLTDMATKAYEDNGYAYPTSDVGEPDTGSQSAGKPGFPVSATADGGVLNYYFSRNGERATEQLTTPYDLPVVQIGRLEADVTYDPNTGDGSIAATEGEHDETVTLSDGTGFSKLGYHLDGWNTAADGSGDAYNLSGDFKLVEKTDVLYAQWIPNEYTIRFHRNHANVSGEMSDQQMTYDVPANLNANTYELTGYSFLGWSYDGDDSYDVDGTTSDDSDATANENANENESEADANNENSATDENENENASDDATDVSVSALAEDADDSNENVNDNANDASDETEDGASDGNTGDEGNANETAPDGSDASVDFADQEEVVNLTSVDGDVIDLYAVWSPNEARIHYIANIDGIIAPDEATKRGESSDATADDSDVVADDVAANENVVSDDAIATSAATDDNGNDAADDTSNDVSDDELDPTIYGSTPDTVGKTDETVQLAENGFKNPNYHFIEWNTSADGTGTSYQPGMDWKLAAGTVNLYAIWSNDPAVIVYDKNSDSATGEMANTDGYIDMEATISDNGFENSGYEFTGWNTEADGSGTAYDEGETIVLTEPSMTLYAQWEEIPVIVQMGAVNSSIGTFGAVAAGMAVLGIAAYAISKRK